MTSARSSKPLCERGTGWQQFIFEFRAGSDTLSQTYTVIYCKHLPDITADTLANSNYITNYFTRLVYKGAKDLLPYFAGFGSPGSYTVRTITYSVVYRNPDGTLGTYEIFYCPVKLYFSL